MLRCNEGSLGRCCGRGRRAGRVSTACGSGRVLVTPTYLLSELETRPLPQAVLTLCLACVDGLRFFRMRGFAHAVGGGRGRRVGDGALKRGVEGFVDACGEGEL